MSGLQTALQPTPRKLTTHQKAVLIQVLLVFPDQQVNVCYSPKALDAFAYAQDFVTIFKAIGWTVKEAESPEIATDRSTGLAVIVSRVPDLPPSAQALRDSLRIYGIEVEVFCDSEQNIAPSSFLLAVG
jgi:hypothetical protein